MHSFEQSPKDIHTTPIKLQNNYLSKDIYLQSNDKKGIKEILTSSNSTLAKKQLNIYKSKFLQLNMAHLEEVVNQQKASNKNETLKLIRELNDSSTAEGSSSLRNVTSEYIPKRRAYIKLPHNRNVQFNNNSIGSSSQTVCQQGINQNKFPSYNKLQILNMKLSNTNTEEIEENQTSKTSSHREILNYTKQTASYPNYNNNNINACQKLNNAISKNVLSNSNSNVNNYKKPSCISFKNSTLINSNSVNCYDIKDFAKLKTMRIGMGINLSNQLSRKIVK